MVHPSELIKFQNEVWDYFARQQRDLPWRVIEPDGTVNPYHVLVSEFMLQQTQVGRVVPKFLAFLEQFPSLEKLAQAPLADVLTAWNGLGYNRRAKYLWQAAQTISQQGGVVPCDQTELCKLPGIGPNTAAAILAYAYNMPVKFIETNIRTVFIHHFYPNEFEVSDSVLRPLIAAAVDQDHPREWYWALMDYGSYLKTTVGNKSRSSKHYVKQSRFEGSVRQLRGRVIKQLIHGPVEHSRLAAEITDERLATVLDGLVAEGLVKSDDHRYSL